MNERRIPFAMHGVRMSGCREPETPPPPPPPPPPPAPPEPGTRGEPEPAIKTPSFPTLDPPDPWPVRRS